MMSLIRLSLIALVAIAASGCDRDAKLPPAENVKTDTKATATVPATVAPAIAAADAAAAPAKTGVPMKPGLWEVNVVSETPGSVSKHGVTSQFCYTAEIMKNTQNLLPPQQEVGMSCMTSDYTLEANTANWQVVCKTGSGTLSGAGTVKTNAESYEGSADLVAKSGSKTSKVLQSFRAKRLGNCE